MPKTARQYSLTLDPANAAQTLSKLPYSLANAPLFQ